MKGIGLLRLGKIGYRSVLDQFDFSKNVKADFKKRLQQMKDECEEQTGYLKADLKKVQDIAKLGSWEWNLQTKNVVWSDQMYAIHDMDPDEEVGIASIRSRILEEDRRKFDRSLRQTLKGMPPRFIEYRITTSSGALKHLLSEGELKFDIHGNISRITGIVQDITDRVKSDEVRRQTEKNYKRIVDNSPTGIFRSTTDGKLVFANDSMANIFGFDAAEELQGLESESLYKNPDDRKELLNKIKQVGQLKDYPMECLAKDGTQLTVSLTSVLDKDIIHGILIDITKRIQSENEKSALIKRLEEQNNDLEHFAHVISHNLRSPIANLIGLTQIFDNESCSKENLEIVNLIRESTNNLDLIIRDLNKTLTIRDRRNEIYELVQMEQVLETVRVRLNGQIEKGGIRITTNITEADHFKSIKSYIENILFNLVDNGIKFKSSDRLCEINIDFEKSAEMYQIIVRDNGIGMDLESSGKRIFKLYEILNPNNIDNGRGLGLYHVKNQVNALNGKVEVKSRPDIGTEFTIELPNNK